MFDNRQLATLILLAILGLAVSIKASSRKGAVTVFKSFFKVKVAGPFTLYLAWLLGVHWIVAKTGLWNERLLGDSIFWVGVTGFSLVFRVTSPKTTQKLFRTLIFDLLKITAFFIFFLNIKPLSLGGEIVLQIAVSLLLLLRSLATHKAEWQPLLRICDTLILIIVMGMTVYTVISLAHDWKRMDWWHEGRKFLLPFWLTLGAIPYLYGIGLLARYETLFAMSRISTHDNRPTVWAKLGIVLALHGRLNEIHDFRRYTYLANNARSIRQGRDAVRKFREIEACKTAAARDAQLRLQKNAGVVGTDEDGRQLDQREFKETTDALRWLASCQMGWYRNQGQQYPADLLDRLGDSFKRYGLPAAHGIVMSVSSDGQRWYAYRKTPSGLVLGIGARDAPPDQWFYESDAPPSSFPSPGAGWGEAAHSKEVNWRRVHR